MPCLMSYFDSQISTYLADVAAGDDRTTLVSLGQSVEGRDLWQLQVSVGAGKEVVWIDCGIHARELVMRRVLLGVVVILNYLKA